MSSENSPRNKEGSSTTAHAAAASSGPAPPTLPPNVSIFSPPASNPEAYSEVLFQSRVFTRLTISSPTDSGSRPGFYQQVLETLKKRPELMRKEEQGFWLVHKNAVLVFDSSRTSNNGLGDEKEEEEDETVVKDRHHEHVRSVCLALKDGDLGLSIAGCVFDAVDAVGAGFQFDRLSGGTILVIDLMGGDDEEDDEDGNGDDDEDDDEDFDLLAGGEVVV